MTVSLALVACALSAAAPGGAPAPSGRMLLAEAPLAAHGSRVRAYLSRRILVAPVVEAVVPMPRPLYPSGANRMDPGPGPLLGPDPRPVPPGARPARSASLRTGWQATRDGQVLDELEFARIVSDPALVRGVEGYRDRVFWTRWISAAAAPLLAGGGVWLWVARPRDQDARTIAYSLLGLGAVAVVAALFADDIAHRPTITAEQASARADAYNARLRADLGVTAADLAAPVD